MNYKTVILSALLLVPSSVVMADTSGAMKLMTRYQLSSVHGDTTTLYLFKREGWGFSSCPNARLVKINTSQPGFDIAYATTMMAYSNKVKMVLKATCDSTNLDLAHLQHIILEDA
ncbi:MAG: hypothetical protein ACRBCI_07310 [Cellvibrionaceae bacterium]